MKSLIPAAAAAIAALAASPGAGATPARIIPHEVPQEAPRSCPEVMQGVSLVIRPATGGVSLEFTSPRRRQVAELREQLRDAALVIARHSKSPIQLAAATAGQSRLPALDISVSDISAGARVVVRAQRARDLPELLELARTFEVMWTRSDCNEEVGIRRLRALPSIRA